MRTTLIPIDTAVNSIVSGEETDHYMASVATRGVTQMFTIDLLYLRTKLF